MRRAIELAVRAGREGEVPVGALVVRDAEVLGEGWNQSVSTCDPSAHAEIVALRAAGRAAANYRLPGATLYVTLEPCVMCAGAIVQARLAHVVFAARDALAGAAGSIVDLLDSPLLNHRCRVTAGVLAEPCAALLSEFFALRRDRPRS